MAQELGEGRSAEGPTSSSCRGKAPSIQRRDVAVAAAPLAVAVAAVVGASAVAFPSLSGQGFPLDDAWILQVIARNLANTGVWGFQPGQPSSGATSILWTLLLAANQALFRMPPSTYAGILNVLLLAGSCVVLYSLLRQDGIATWPAASLAALPPLLGNVSWLAASGLEPVLVVFLSTGAIALWCRRSAWAGVIAGLAMLARPECLGVPLILTAASWVRRDLRLRGLVLLWLPAAVAAAVTVYVSWTTSHGLLPATFEGRRWLYGLEEPLYVRAIAVAATWVYQLVEAALGWPMALAPVAILAIGAGVWRTVRNFPGLALLTAWALAVNLLYVMLLANIGHGGRYQPLNLFLAPVLAAVGLAGFGSWIGRRRIAPTRIQVLSSAVIAVVCLPSLPTWNRIVHDGVEHINQAHVAVARWARAQVPRGTPIAAFDIGALAYFSEHPILDLGGLVDRDFLPYLEQGRASEYLRERGVHLVALPMDYADTSAIGARLGLVGSRDLTLVTVAEAMAPREIWKPVFEVTGSASPRIALYRVVWRTDASRDERATR